MMREMLSRKFTLEQDVSQGTLRAISGITLDEPLISTLGVAMDMDVT